MALPKNLPEIGRAITPPINPSAVSQAAKAAPRPATETPKPVEPKPVVQPKPTAPAASGYKVPELDEGAFAVRDAIDTASKQGVTLLPAPVSARNAPVPAASDAEFEAQQDAAAKQHAEDAADLAKDRLGLGGSGRTVATGPVSGIRHQAVLTAADALTGGLGSHVIKALAPEIPEVRDVTIEENFGLPDVTAPIKAPMKAVEAITKGPSAMVDPGSAALLRNTGELVGGTLSGAAAGLGKGIDALSDAAAERAVEAERNADAIEAAEKAGLPNPFPNMTAAEWRAAAAKNREMVAAPVRGDVAQALTPADSAFAKTIDDTIPTLRDLAEAKEDPEIQKRGTRYVDNVRDLLLKYDTQKQGDAAKFIGERAKFLVNQATNGGEITDPNEVRRITDEARNTALTELAYAKVIGAWTGPAFLPGALVQKQGATKSALGAFAPSVELLGIDKRGNYITRQASLPGWLMNDVLGSLGMQFVATGIPDAVYRAAARGQSEGAARIPSIGGAAAEALGLQDKTSPEAKFGEGDEGFRHALQQRRTFTDAAQDATPRDATTAGNIARIVSASALDVLAPPPIEGAILAAKVGGASAVRAIPVLRYVGEQARTARVRDLGKALAEADDAGNEAAFRVRRETAPPREPTIPPEERPTEPGRPRPTDATVASKLAAELAAQEAAARRLERYSPTLRTEVEEYAAAAFQKALSKEAAEALVEYVTERKPGVPEEDQPSAVRAPVRTVAEVIQTITKRIEEGRITEKDVAILDHVADAAKKAREEAFDEATRIYDDTARKPIAHPATAALGDTTAIDFLASVRAGHDVPAVTADHANAAAYVAELKAKANPTGVDALSPKAQVAARAARKELAQFSARMESVRSSTMADLVNSAITLDQPAIDRLKEHLQATLGIPVHEAFLPKPGQPVTVADMQRMDAMLDLHKNRPLGRDNLYDVTAPKSAMRRVSERVFGATVTETLAKVGNMARATVMGGDETYPMTQSGHSARARQVVIQSERIVDAALADLSNLAPEDVPTFLDGVPKDDPSRPAPLTGGWSHYINFLQALLPRPRGGAILGRAELEKLGACFIRPERLAELTNNRKVNRAFLDDLATQTYDAIAHSETSAELIAKLEVIGKKIDGIPDPGGAKRAAALIVTYGAWIPVMEHLYGSRAVLTDAQHTNLLDFATAQQGKPALSYDAEFREASRQARYQARWELLVEAAAAEVPKAQQEFKTAQEAEEAARLNRERAEARTNRVREMKDEHRDARAARLREVEEMARAGLVPNLPLTDIERFADVTDRAVDALVRERMIDSHADYWNSHQYQFAYNASLQPKASVVRAERDALHAASASLLDAMAKGKRDGVSQAVRAYVEQLGRAMLAKSGKPIPSAIDEVVGAVPEATRNRIEAESIRILNDMPEKKGEMTRAGARASAMETALEAIVRQTIDRAAAEPAAPPAAPHPTQTRAAARGFTSPPPGTHAAALDEQHGPRGTATTTATGQPRVAIDQQRTQWPVELAIVPVERLRTSHDPGTGQPTPGYNQALQNRPDWLGRLDQMDAMVRDFQPAEANPEAIDMTSGPPVVWSQTDAADVLAGNLRANAIKRMLAENGESAARYRKLVDDAKAAYNITPDVPEGYTGDVVLVRRARIDPGDLASAVRLANNSQQGLSPELAKIDKIISQAVTARAAIGDIAAELKDLPLEMTTEAADQLLEDSPAIRRAYHAMYPDEGVRSNLSGDDRRMAVQAALLLALDTDTLTRVRAAGTETATRVMNAMPAFLTLRTMAKDKASLAMFDLAPTLKDALDLVDAAHRKGERGPSAIAAEAEVLRDQLPLIGKSIPVSAPSVALAIAIDSATSARGAGSELALARKMNGVVEEAKAQSQVSMFSAPKDPVVAITDELAGPAAETARRLPSDHAAAIARAAQKDADAAKQVEAHGGRGALFQEQERPLAPTFYSGLRRAVEDIPREKVGVDELRAMLKKHPLAKTDEIDFVKLDEFLAGKKSVTKAEVIDWLDEHALQVVVREVDEASSPIPVRTAAEVAATPEWTALKAELTRRGASALELDRVQRDPIGDTSTEVWEKYFDKQADADADLMYELQTAYSDVMPRPGETRRADLQYRTRTVPGMHELHLGMNAEQQAKYTEASARADALHTEGERLRAEHAALWRRRRKADVVAEAMHGDEMERLLAERDATDELVRTTVGTGRSAHMAERIQINRKLGDLTQKMLSETIERLGPLLEASTKKLAANEDAYGAAMAELKAINPRPPEYRNYTLPAGEHERNVAFFLPLPAGETQAAYGAPHSFGGSSENLIAHFRVTSRWVNGKWTLFVEEIQSDWHQDGLKRGYRDEQALAKKRAELASNQAKRDQIWHDTDQNDRDRLYFDNPEFKRLDDEKDALEANIRVLSEGIPDAPMKSTSSSPWHQMAMKRIYRMAAEEGYDAVAWTRGQTQVERYPQTFYAPDIGHHPRMTVDEIRWSRGGKGRVERAQEELAEAQAEYDTLKSKSAAAYEAALNRAREAIAAKAEAIRAAHHWSDATDFTWMMTHHATPTERAEFAAIKESTRPENILRDPEYAALDAAWKAAGERVQEATTNAKRVEKSGIANHQVRISATGARGHFAGDGDPGGHTYTLANPEDYRVQPGASVDGKPSWDVVALVPMDARDHALKIRRNLLDTTLTERQNRTAIGDPELEAIVEMVAQRLLNVAPTETPQAILSDILGDAPDDVRADIEARLLPVLSQEQVQEVRHVRSFPTEAKAEAFRANIAEHEGDMPKHLGREMTARILRESDVSDRRLHVNKVAENRFDVVESKDHWDDEPTTLRSFPTEEEAKAFVREQHHGEARRGRISSEKPLAEFDGVVLPAAIGPTVPNMLWRNGFDIGDGEGKPAIFYEGIDDADDAKELSNELDHLAQAYPNGHIAVLDVDGVVVDHVIVKDGVITHAPPPEFSIGGRGMKAFYDERLPQFANEYARKNAWGPGSNVREGTMTVTPDREILAGINNAAVKASKGAPADGEMAMLGSQLHRIVDEVQQGAKLRDVVRRVLLDNRPFPELRAAISQAVDDASPQIRVHYQPLTEAAKEHVLYKGQTLFQRDEETGINITVEDARDLDAMLKKPTRTGLAHLSPNAQMAWDVLQDARDYKAGPKDTKVVLDELHRIGEGVRYRLIGELESVGVFSEPVDAVIAILDEDGFGSPRLEAAVNAVMDLYDGEDLDDMVGLDAITNIGALNEQFRMLASSKPGPVREATLAATLRQMARLDAGDHLAFAGDDSTLLGVRGREEAQQAANAWLDRINHARMQAHVNEATNRERILFQDDVAEPKNLLVMHQVPARWVLESDRHGGRIPSPSLGVGRVEHPFGGVTRVPDVTLIGRPHMTVDPETPWFEGDAYTPMHPGIGMHPDDALADMTAGPVRGGAGSTDMTGDLAEMRAAILPELDKPGMQARRDRITPDYDHAAGVDIERDIQALATKKMPASAFGVRAVRRAIIDAGNGMSDADIAADLDEHITEGHTKAAMMGVFANAAGRPWGSGTGSDYARVMMHAHSIGNKVDAGATIADALAAELKKILDPAMAKIMREIVEPAAQAEAKPPTLTTPEDVAAVRALTKRVLDLPVTYFEGKPQRHVTLSEFHTAVAPDTTDPKVIAALQKHGIRVETYTAVTAPPNTARMGTPAWNRMEADVKAAAAATELNRTAAIQKVAADNPSLLFQDADDVNAQVLGTAKDPVTGRPRSKATELRERLAATKFITPAELGAIMGERRPDYLDPVIDFILRQRQVVRSGQLNAREVAKAYIMTVASQGAGAINAEKIEGLLGHPLEERFITYGKPTRKGAPAPRMVRPEEAMAAALYEPFGQAALDGIEAGTYDDAAWQKVADIRRAFGDDKRIDNVLGAPNPKVKGQVTMANIGEIVDGINKARGDYDAIEKELTRLRGVQVGKSAFVGHLLGFGEMPTIDARETSGWLNGKVDEASLKSARLRAKHAEKEVLAGAINGGPPDIVKAFRDRIMKRYATLKARGVEGADLPDEVFGAVMHHWFWDAVKDTQTSHQGVFDAAEPPPKRGGRGAQDEPLPGGGKRYKGGIEFVNRETGLGLDPTLTNREFIKVGKALITLTEHADLSTLFHEGAHLMRRLIPADQMAEIDAYVKARWGEDGWLAGGRKNSPEEWFARNFETWLRDGNLVAKDATGMDAAELAAVNKAFTSVARVMTRIYARGVPISEDIAPRAEPALHAADKAAVAQLHSWLDRFYRTHREDFAEKGETIPEPAPIPVTPAKVHPGEVQRELGVGYNEAARIADERNAASASAKARHAGPPGPTAAPPDFERVGGTVEAQQHARYALDAKRRAYSMTGEPMWSAQMTRPHDAPPVPPTSRPRGFRLWLNREHQNVEGYLSGPDTRDFAARVGLPHVPERQTEGEFSGASHDLHEAHLSGKTAKNGKPVKVPGPESDARRAYYEALNEHPHRAKKQGRLYQDDEPTLSATSDDLLRVAALQRALDTGNTEAARTAFAAMTPSASMVWDVLARSKTEPPSLTHAVERDIRSHIHRAIYDFIGDFGWQTEGQELDNAFDAAIRENNLDAVREFLDRAITAQRERLATEIRDENPHATDAMITEAIDNAVSGDGEFYNGAVDDRLVGLYHIRDIVDLGDELPGIILEHGLDAPMTRDAITNFTAGYGTQYTGNLAAAHADDVAMLNEYLGDVAKDSGMLWQDDTRLTITPDDYEALAHFNVAANKLNPEGYTKPHKTKPLTPEQEVLWDALAERDIAIHPPTEGGLAEAINETPADIIPTWLRDDVLKPTLDAIAPRLAEIDPDNALSISAFVENLRRAIDDPTGPSADERVLRAALRRAILDVDAAVADNYAHDPDYDYDTGMNAAGELEEPREMPQTPLVHAGFEFMADEPMYQDFIRAVLTYVDIAREVSDNPEHMGKHGVALAWLLGQIERGIYDAESQNHSGQRASASLLQRRLDAAPTPRRYWQDDATEHPRARGSNEYLRWLLTDSDPDADRPDRSRVRYKDTVISTNPDNDPHWANGAFGQVEGFVDTPEGVRIKIQPMVTIAGREHPVLDIVHDENGQPMIGPDGKPVRTPRLDAMGEPVMHSDPGIRRLPVGDVVLVRPERVQYAERGRVYRWKEDMYETALKPGTQQKRRVFKKAIAKPVPDGLWKDAGDRYTRLVGAALGTPEGSPERADLNAFIDRWHTNLFPRPMTDAEWRAQNSAEVAAGGDKWKGKLRYGEDSDILYSHMAPPHKPSPELVIAPPEGTRTRNRQVPRPRGANGETAAQVVQDAFEQEADIQRGGLAPGGVVEEPAAAPAAPAPAAPTPSKYPTIAMPPDDVPPKPVEAQDAAVATPPRVPEEEAAAIDAATQEAIRAHKATEAAVRVQARALDAAKRKLDDLRAAGPKKAVSSARKRKPMLGARGVSDTLEARALFGTPEWTRASAGSANQAAPTESRQLGAGAKSNTARIIQSLIPDPQDRARMAAMQELMDERQWIPAAVRKMMGDKIGEIMQRTPEDKWPTAGPIVSAWKLAVTRGAFITKPRYFLNNISGDFDQTVAAHGFTIAIKNAIRQDLQNLQAVPGVGNVTSALGWSEKIRRALQAGGEQGLAVVDFLTGHSAQRLEVNKVLDGLDDTVMLGGRLYKYSDIRDAWVKAGVFEGFDVAELHQSLQQDAPGVWKRAMDIATQQKAIQDIAEGIATRKRVGLGLTLLEEGMSLEAAGKGVVDALYDYKYSMSAGDKHWITKTFLPFWAWQKNANRQMIGAAFSPRGIYKMRVIYQAKKVGANLVTAYLDDRDENGVRRNEMPIDVQTRYLELVEDLRDQGLEAPEIAALLAAPDIQNENSAYGWKHWGAAYGIDADVVPEILPYMAIDPVRQPAPSFYADTPAIRFYPPVGVSPRDYDTDTYRAILAPPGTFEGALGFAGSVMGFGLNIVQGKPATAIDQLSHVADPERAPLLGPLVSTVTMNQHPYMPVSNAIGSFLQPYGVTHVQPGKAGKPGAPGVRYNFGSPVVWPLWQASPWYAVDTAVQRGEAARGKDDLLAYTELLTGLNAPYIVPGQVIQQEGWNTAERLKLISTAKQAAGKAPIYYPSQTTGSEAAVKKAEEAATGGEDTGYAPPATAKDRR